MFPLILAHIVAYCVFFVFGLPLAGSLLHSQSIGYGGGLLLAVGLSLSCEVVVFAGAILGKFAADALKINPLMQRNRAEAISMAAISVLMVPFLLGASRLAVLQLSLNFASAIAVTVVFVGFLATAVRVKRFCITHFVK